MSSGLILPLHLAGRGAPGVGASAPAVRDPEPPEFLVRELREEDPRWFPRFSRYPTPHWDVCERWLPNDPKRARIRSGELPPDADFNILCYCPPDIRAGDVVGYVRQRLVRVVDVQRQADAEQAARERANADVRAKHLTHARVELEHQLSGMDKHERELAAGATTAHPMIQGADLT